MVEFVKIKEVCDFKKGKKVKIVAGKSEKAIPYLLIDTLRGAPPEAFTRDSAYTEADEDDVLIVCDGANSGLVGTGVRGAVGSTIARLRIKQNVVNKDYFMYFLRLNFSNLNTDIKGAAIPHLKPDKMLNLEIRKLELKEQTKTVENIETQFTRLDATIKSLKVVREKIEVYRKSILKAAFKARLLSQKIDYGDVNLSLQSLTHERRNHWEREQLEKFIAKGTIPKNGKWKEKYKALKEVNCEGVYSLPATWKWTTLDNISDVNNNALKAGPFGSSLKKEYYVSKGYKIYGQEQVIKGDAFYGDYYIDEKRYKSLESCKVREGDLLISLVGTIGKMLIIPEKFEEGIINPRLVKISLHRQTVSPQYLKYYLESPFALHRLTERSHGQTMSILNLTILKELPIPLAPVDEQLKIVEGIDFRFSVIDKLETVIDASILKAETLRKSILKSAFEGKLVN